MDKGIVEVADWTISYHIQKRKSKSRVQWLTDKQVKQKTQGEQAFVLTHLGWIKRLLLPALVWVTGQDEWQFEISSQQFVFEVLDDVAVVAAAAVVAVAVPVALAHPMLQPQKNLFYCQYHA